MVYDTVIIKCILLINSSKAYQLNKLYNNHHHVFGVAVEQSLSVEEGYGGNGISFGIFMFIFYIYAG